MDASWSNGGLVARQGVNHLATAALIAVDRCWFMTGTRVSVVPSDAGWRRYIIPTYDQRAADFDPERY